MATESQELETAELIRNIKDYDPSKPNNAQLADDMRICFAWYSSLRQGKKLKFTLDEVIELARKIYNEIEKRKREGKMKHEWKPEQMKKYSKELFDFISKTKSFLCMSLENEVLDDSCSTKGDFNSCVGSIGSECCWHKDTGCVSTPIISVSHDFLHLNTPSNLKAEWFYPLVKITEDWGYGTIEKIEDAFATLIHDYKLSMISESSYNRLLEDWYRFDMRYHHPSFLISDKEAQNLIISKIDSVLERDDLPSKVREWFLAEKGRLHFLFPHQNEIKLDSNPAGAKVFLQKEGEDEEFFVGRTPLSAWIDWDYTSFEGDKSYQFKLIWHDGTVSSGSFDLPSSGTIDLGTIEGPPLSFPPAILNVYSNPPGAEIWVDGVNQHVTTPAKIFIDTDSKFSKKVKIALKKKYFVDRNYSVTVRPSKEETFFKNLVGSVKICGKTSKGTHYVTFKFIVGKRGYSCKKLFNGSGIVPNVDLYLMNLTTGVKKSLTTDPNSGIGEVTIDYSDPFFIDGRQKLVCAISNEGNRIRSFRSITIPKFRSLDQSETESDWQAEEFDSEVEAEKETSFDFEPGTLSHFGTFSSGTRMLAKIPEGKGQLSISSSPSLAEIWIDNKNTKLLTPEAQIFLDPGSHFVKLKKPHYQDYSFSVSILEGEKIEKFCELSPKFAVLTLFSVPSHARIFIDGTDQNKVTPETFKFDIPGSSKTLDVTLKLPGFKDAEIDNLVLHPGDKIEKVIHLEPGTSTLSQLETLPIYPGNVSPRFDPLDLDEFLQKWNSFYLRKPFIILVGSLANWQRTEGDIDILVKARDPTPLLNALDRAIIKCFKMNEDQLADLLIQVHQFIHSDSLFLLTRWRIERAFPEWKGRIQVLDDSFSGPFTNFVELADLAAVARSEKVRQEMAQRGIKLFQWFPMLKPMHGRQKGEIYSVDSVIDIVKSRKEDWFNIGIFVEKKFDGVHCQAHKSDDKVLILTEDGSDVTRNCPTLADAIAKLSHEFILCGEIELWKDGKHQPRADTAGVLNSKDVDLDEKHLVYNVFDILYFDGKDLHDLPYERRLEYLAKLNLPKSGIVRESERVLCHSEDCLRKAIEKFAAKEGSEGAYLKLADFKYQLTGKTNENIKYKKERSLDAVVLKRNKVAKTEKTYYYHCGLKSDHDIVYCGKTFNTNIKAEPGDIIKVVFVDISGYTDPKTGKRWVNWWAPRVVMLRTDKKEPDTIDTAWRMVKETTGRFEEKPMPDIKNLEQLDAESPTHKDCINFDPESHMCKLHNRLVDPDAPACPDFQPLANLSASAKRFVIQNHFRGSSSHGDFRVQLDHMLGGFTLGWQRADELKRELEKHWQLKKTKDRYEIYWDGELMYALDKRENVVQEPSAALKKRVFEFHKKLATDPKFWKIDMNTGEELKRKGSVRDEVEKIFCVQKTREPFEWLSVEGVTKPREVEPEPGGTRFFPGIFVEMDSGTYYPGAQKPYFKEYFLNGKKWKGRVVFRLVAGLQGTKAVANWLYWKPDDQTPYVLSARAVRDNWLPAEGSAMPPEWEQKLPEELHFWKATDRKKKLELRKLAREYLKKKEVLSADDEVEFVLTHRYWQGQYVVRGLPVEDYHIKIGEHRFHLDKDPTHKFPEHGISALQFHDKDEYFVEGEKKPQSSVNPNRKIPAYIHVLDRGKAEIIADEPLYLHVRLNGKKLKGLFYFRRTSRDAEFWMFKKGMESF